MNVKLRDKYKGAFAAIQKDFAERNPADPIPTYPQIVESLLDAYLAERYQHKLIALAKKSDSV